MNDQHVTAMVMESIYSTRFPDLIQSKTKAKYVVVPYSVGAMGTKSYLDLIDMWVSKYREVLR